MKGNIYTEEVCPICGVFLVHSQDKNGFLCHDDPTHPLTIPKNMRVKFGRNVSKRFTNHQYNKARQFLEGIRYKTYENTFDERDYKKNNPLGFETLADKWLTFKEIDCKSKNTFRNIKRDINKAILVWRDKNIKSISDGDIENFLYSLRKKDGDLVSDKTRSNTKSVLNDFWSWVVRRGKRNGKNLIEMPNFPDCKFVLGWRNIVDIDTQQAILDEIKRISYDINPKIWLGVKWLCTYISIRPGEMISLKERHINLNGVFVVPENKENHPKIVPMLPEDIGLYESFPKTANQDLYFFRHTKGNGGAKPGQQFGKDYLYKWAKQAMKNLDIEDVDLYGMTKHSTTTALGEYFSEQELMDHGTTHKSNKAFRRYMQADKSKSLTVYQKVSELWEKQ